MPWNLFLIPLVAGYYLYTRSNYLKFRQRKVDRQRLIFDSILWGILLTIISFIIGGTANYFAPRIVTWSLNQLPLKGDYAGTVLGTLILSFLIVQCGNRWFCKDGNPQILAAIRAEGSQLEKLIAQTYNTLHLLQFTLDSGKFYVGWVSALPVPRASNYIKMIPAFSGYRDSVDQSLVFTTQYLEVYASYVKEGRVKDLKDVQTTLIITMDNVITLSTFDIDTYRRFNTNSVDDPKAP